MIDLNVLLCKGCSFCVKFCPKNILELGKERSKKDFSIRTLLTAKSASPAEFAPPSVRRAQLN